MQSIFIDHLEAETIIGVYPNERLAPQALVLDIEIGLPNARGFTTDQLADTVDYAAVVALVRRELQTHSFHLLERLAHHLCEQIERQTDATQIRMRIAKPGILPGTRAVGVILERGFPRVGTLPGAEFADHSRQ